MATRESIIEKAQYCLSESTNAGVNFIEDNILPVEHFVDEAGRRVIMLAPLRVLGKGKTFGGLALINNGVVEIELPNDFIRLISFKMEDWERAVHTPIYDTDPQYAWQLHPATRGGKTKPVVAITNGGTKLEGYTTSDDDTIKNFQYFAYTSINDNFPEKLEDATAWMTASLYLASMGELDMAKVLESKSIELLQLV